MSTLNDSIGTDHGEAQDSTGTPSSDRLGATAIVPALSAGSAIEFTSVEERFTLPSTQAAPWTITWWTENLTAGLYIMSGSEISVLWSSSSLYLKNETSASPITTDFTPATLHNYALVCTVGTNSSGNNSYNCRLWLDGVDVGSGLGKAITTGTLSNILFSIGQTLALGTTGKFDEILLFDKALSEAEIKQLYTYALRSP